MLRPHPFRCVLRNEKTNYYVHYNLQKIRNVTIIWINSVCWWLSNTGDSPVNSLRPSEHICVSKLTIIGSDNSLSPGRRQTIIWTSGRIWLIRTLGTNFINSFSFKKMPLKRSPAKWRQFCLSLLMYSSHQSCTKPSIITAMVKPVRLFNVQLSVEINTSTGYVQRQGLSARLAIHLHPNYNRQRCPRNQSMIHSIRVIQHR